MMDSEEGRVTSLGKLCKEVTVTLVKIRPCRTTQISKKESSLTSDRGTLKEGKED